MNIADFTDAQLMELFRAGREDAFEELFTRHQARVVRLATRMTGNGHDAQEILQETFLRIARAAPRYEPTALFTTWLYRIAVNCCYSHARGKARLRLLPFPAPGVVADDQPFDRARSKELQGKLRREVARLPETLRTPFVLSEFEGLSYAETAAALSLPMGTVKTHIHRARLKLRSALASELSAHVTRDGKAAS